jgi:hypothetical protein
MQPQDIWFPVYIESFEVLSGPSRYLLGGYIHGCDYNQRQFSLEIITVRYLIVNQKLFDIKSLALDLFLKQVFIFVLQFYSKCHAILPL